MELTFNTQKKMHFIFYHFLRGDAPHVSQKGRLSGWGSHADSIFKNVINFVARCTDGQEAKKKILNERSKDLIKRAEIDKNDRNLTSS